MEVKVKEVVKYGGHSLSANGSVNFTLKAEYSELTNTMLDQAHEIIDNSDIIIHSDCGFHYRLDC